MCFGKEDSDFVMEINFWGVWNYYPQASELAQYVQQENEGQFYIKLEKIMTQGTYDVVISKKDGS